MTRAELQTEAERLARELGRTVDVGVSRSKLETLVGELTAELAARQGTEVPGALQTTDVEPGPAEQIPTTDLVAGEVLQPMVNGAAPEAEGGPPPPAPPASRAPRVPYYVAPRRSTIVRGRVVGPFTPVKASDFERGQSDLDYLVQRGVVVKTGL